MGHKAQHPLADMPLAEFQLSGGGRKGGAVGQAPHGPRPFGQPDRGLLFPEPPRQGGPCVVRHLNLDGRVASLHILPPSMSCRRHGTAAITLPIFPSLFNGDLYLGSSTLKRGEVRL